MSVTEITVALGREWLSTGMPLYGIHRGAARPTTTPYRACKIELTAILQACIEAALAGDRYVFEESLLEQTTRVCSSVVCKTRGTVLLCAATGVLQAASRCQGLQHQGLLGIKVGNRFILTFWAGTPAIVA